MFKAKKRNPKQKKAFRKKEDDDEDEKEEDGGASESIARIKKKRKLLTELQFKKGTDAASLLKGRVVDDLPSAPEKAADSVGLKPSSQEGIMEQKHKQALENYVNSKLAAMTGDDEKKDKSAAENDDDPNKKLTKDELYKQLAHASEAMVGRRMSHETKEQNAQDGDVGTGGAMLVAGTGLAEVILPVEERLKAVQATQEASRPRVQNKNNYMGMPNSAVPAPKGAARFQVSAADRHRHFPSDNNKNNNNPTNNNNNNNLDNRALAEEQSDANDGDRAGFDAARGKAAGGSAGTNGNSGTGQGRENRNTRASDDKVYGKFLKNHRENQGRYR